MVMMGVPEKIMGCGVADKLICWTTGDRGGGGSSGCVDLVLSEEGLGRLPFRQPPPTGTFRRVPP